MGRPSAARSQIGEPILHDLGYLMHDGGHGTVPSDFDVYIKFMDMHFMK